ncbi:Seed trypsin/chymotrypsin inhibitor TI5-72 [Glycine max]|nr:Seed trypsin/chymotrypsin inhibitor TI5-72 [Glycine max]
MELKKVGLVLFLLGFTATTVDATGFNPNSLITQLLPQIEGDSDDNYVKSNTEPCCDNCLCTNSIPPKCQCTDWAEDCHSACKGGYGLLGVDVSMKLTHAMTNVPAPPKKLPKLMIATTKQAFLLCVYACMHANITIIKKGLLSAESTVKEYIFGSKKESQENHMEKVSLQPLWMLLSSIQVPSPRVILITMSKPQKQGATQNAKEMEMKKLVLVKVALLFLFICFTASNVDARSRSINPGSFIIAGDNYNLKSTTSACCDACACTKSIPPICHCHDFGETCHSACNLCICTASYPPQCRCLDQTTFCYDKCDSSEDKAHSE